ncbi:MAG: hypothetical protein AB7I18_00830 [Candidatus Berkiella sp.]
MIHITQYSPNAIKDCEQRMYQGVLIAQEERKEHTANYPLHNRYFSNGDKPWVILINTRNSMKLFYLDKAYVIQENELVLFDDNILHAWEMNNNDMTIYYYRAKTDTPIKQGNYCLDDYF